MCGGDDNGGGATIGTDRLQVAAAEELRGPRNNKIRSAAAFNDPYDYIVYTYLRIQKYNKYIIRVCVKNVH